jgi:UDP-N-acetyl-D-mannosaminuronate dehydrogenase
MPEFVAQLVTRSIRRRRRSTDRRWHHRRRQRDVNDLRESPALEIIELLHHRGAMVATPTRIPSFKHAGLFWSRPE